MKKSLMLPIFVVALFVGQAWAQYSPCAAPYDGWCKWGSNCYDINMGADNTDNCSDAYANCVENSTVFSDAACTIYKAGNNPDYNSPGCCKWNTGGCWKIKDAEEYQDCQLGGIVIPTCLDFTVGDANGTCPDDGGTSSSSSGGTEYCLWDDCYELDNPNDSDTNNPTMTRREVCIAFSNGLFNNATCSGTPIAGGPLAPQPGQCADNQNRGLFCDWGNGCYRLNTNETQTTCQAAIAHCTTNGEGLFWGVDGKLLTEENEHGKDLVCANIGGQPSTAGGTSSSSSSGTGNSSSSSGGGNSSSSGTTSIILDPTIIGLNVLVQTGSLRISSAREATVQLFDINGKRVFREKVPGGHNVINLKNQKIGVYFAVVSSGSDKQIVKITLK
ncbi:MAG: T9SS type A sorting domain-containing protein [Fibromonadaceae bacterium]|nr:T9SS type A sorting domain-containing protein [Fibromonadaceae bacterium]